MALRNYINGAPLLTLAVEVDTGAVILEVDSTAGYPEAPFVIALERGTSNEEVTLCTEKTATTFTVTRGWDGTTPKNHSIGAAVEHTTAAIDYVEANVHHNSVGDVHPQYVLKTGFSGKGRVLVGTGAGAFTALAVGADATVFQADAAAASGTKWATIGTNSIANEAVTEGKMSVSAQTGLVSRLNGANPPTVEGRINFRQDLNRWFGYRAGWKLMTFGAGFISWGTGAPSGGTDGDLYFRY